MITPTANPVRGRRATAVTVRSVPGAGSLVRAARRASSRQPLPAKTRRLRVLEEDFNLEPELEPEEEAEKEKKLTAELEHPEQEQNTVAHEAREAELVSESDLAETEQQPVDLASPADLAVGTPPAEPQLGVDVHADAQYTELPKPAGAAQHQEETFGAVRPRDPKAAEQNVFDLEVLSSEAAAEVVISPAKEDKAAEESSAESEAATVVTEILRDQPSPSLTLKQVLSFSIPALAGIMTDPLMSFVDTACVGRMSSTELAAMGPNTAIYNFVLQIFTCFIVYTCGQVSKLSAKAEHDKVFKLVSHALFLGVTTGCVVAAGLIGFSYPLLGSMDTLPELMAPAASYLRIRAISMPAVLVCMVSGAFCLGRKDSTTPLLVAIASTITNLLGDIVLIFGPAKMGITGAAIATSASVYVGAAYYLWKVKSQIPLRLEIPGWRDVKPFLTTSSMLTIRNMSIMFNFVAMTMFAGAYGAVATACHQVAISVFMIGNLSAEPFSQCAQSFLASIGSMKRRGPEEHGYLVSAMWLLVKVTVVVGALMGLLTAGMCAVPSLFTTDAVIGAKVGVAAPIVGFAVWLSCINCVTDGFVFANGDLMYSSITALLNIPILLAILNAAGKLGFGWTSVWIGMACFYAIRLAENSARVLYLNAKRKCTKEHAA